MSEAESDARSRLSCVFESFGSCFLHVSHKSHKSKDALYRLGFKLSFLVFSIRRTLPCSWSLSFQRVLSLVSSSNSCKVSIIISFLIGFDGVVLVAAGVAVTEAAAACDANALSRLDKIDARAFAR